MPREREEGLLSVIQTEQTESILEDSMLRAESSQSRQKAYSSLESSLDNRHSHKSTHIDKLGWLMHKCCSRYMTDTYRHRAKYTHKPLSRHLALTWQQEGNNLK